MQTAPLQIMYTESSLDAAVPAILTGVALLAICITAFGAVTAAPDYITEKQYTYTCREFASHFDDLPVKTCVEYLEENPDATGQDILDHQADLQALEREMLLAEPLLTERPVPPTGNGSCQHFDSRRNQC